MGSIELGSVVVEEQALDTVSQTKGTKAKYVEAANVEDVLTNGCCHGHVSGNKVEKATATEEEPYKILEEPNRRGRKIRVITIGAGASALNFAHDIDTSPLDIELAIYEKNPEIGGTWYENR